MKISRKLRAKRRQVKKSIKGSREKREVARILGTKGRNRWRLK